MLILLQYAFLFFVGSLSGWVLELVYRKIIKGKWVNPGFLVGPCLPIYGVGICSLYFVNSIFGSLNVNNPLIIILFMGLSMTLIELVGGLYFLKHKIKLWDYSRQWGNYKGIICPLFSIIWLLGGAIYYYLGSSFFINLVNWYTSNIAFSFIIGFFYGILIIDFFYSTKLLNIIKTYAKENKIIARYEELKLKIKKLTDEAKEKYSFWFPFKNFDKIMNKTKNNRFVNLFKRKK